MSQQRAETIENLERLFPELMWAAQQALAQRLAPFNLTIPQYLALLTIKHRGPNATLGEVGEAIGAPASSMTSIADRLARMNLVERASHPTDRRAIVVRTTAQGDGMVSRFEALSHDAFVEDVAHLSDRDLVSLYELLSRMLASEHAGPDVVGASTNGRASPPA